MCVFHFFYFDVAKIECLANDNLMNQQTGSGLEATPEIVIIPDTGSDHDGIKATWSGGISTDASGSDNGNDCGYVPSSCSGDLSWAVSSGKNRYPQYYPYFESVTGTALSAASQDDMVAYWVCTGQVLIAYISDSDS